MHSILIEELKMVEYPLHKGLLRLLKSLENKTDDRIRVQN